MSGPLSDLQARLRQIVETRGGGVVPVEDPVGEVRVQQAAARMRAWQADLARADHAALAHWQLGDLETDQHPGVLRHFVDGLSAACPKVINLILNGRVGPGKTTAAIAAGNYAAEQGLTVRFVKHSTYLAWLRPEGAPDGLTAAQIRQRYRQPDLLILDDLGADMQVHDTQGRPKEASEYVQRETLDLVGDRLTAGRATIYTTNLTSALIGEQLGERALSRIGARAFPVRFEGADRRKPVTW